jgi:hypothetical protein
MYLFFIKNRQQFIYAAIQQYLNHPAPQRGELFQPKGNALRFMQQKYICPDGTT